MHWVTAASMAARAQVGQFRTCGAGYRQVSRSWFRIRNTYGVDVAPGENDALIVCIAICLGRIHDDTDRDH